MPAPPTDSALLALLRDDPEAGLRAAMQAWAPLVKAICIRVLPGQPDEVEECEADVFIALWRHAARLAREQVPLRAWLAVTARNKAINRYHALHRARLLPLDEELAAALGELAEFDRTASEAEDLVAAWVSALPPPDREIFLRRYYLLQSSREIAAALGMREGNVNTRLSRGRERLRKVLQEKGVTRHA